MPWLRGPGIHLICPEYSEFLTKMANWPMGSRVIVRYLAPRVLKPHMMDGWHYDWYNMDNDFHVLRRMHYSWVGNTWHESSISWHMMDDYTFIQSEWIIPFISCPNAQPIKYVFPLKPMNHYIKEDLGSHFKLHYLENRRLKIYTTKPKCKLMRYSAVATHSA